MNVISAILLNEHPVKGCIQDGNGNTKPFPIFAIDGLPLNILSGEDLIRIVLIISILNPIL